MASSISVTLSSIVILILALRATSNPIQDSFYQCLALNTKSSPIPFSSCFYTKIPKFENMKTRGTKKTAARPTASPDLSLTDSPPIKFSFDLNTFNIPTNSATKATSSSKKTKRNDVNNKISAAAVPTGASSPMNNPSSISDLKALASSRLEAVKRQIERSHSDFVKDVEAFHARLHKRLKIQTQGCQQAVEEVEKEYKKINEKIGESQEAMKASYMEFIAEAQASASRVCKTSIPELAQSLEKSVESLRSRYGNASNLG